jgi:hypothetical protein
MMAKFVDGREEGAPGGADQPSIVWTFCTPSASASTSARVL